MEEQFENPAEEIKRLRHCINDLISVLALPAAWSGCEPFQIVRILFDSLLGILPLDLIYLRLRDSSGEAPIEMSWAAQPQRLANGPQEIGALLNQCLGQDSQKWPASVRKRIGDEEISLVPFRLGLQDEIGVIVAGSQRPDFPRQTERLLLNVAANQAAIWLQEARRLSEQKRLANELDLRVAEQTVELAAANKELKKEIAERSQVEERLRKEERELKGSEARKTAILNSALDCIVTIDHEARITEFNPAAERAFGHRRDEVMGKPLADIIIPPSLREAHHRGFAHYLATGLERVLGRRVEMTAMRSDGSEFPVELAITRIPLDGPPSFTGYLRDITERKQAEEKLLRSEAYLAEAQKLSQTGSFGWNVSTDEHFWSEETFRIFQYDTSAKVTLQMVLERVHPEDVLVLKQILERATRDGKDWEHEYRLSLPDGSLKHVHVVARATGGKSGKPEFVGAVMDVTAARRAEEILRQKQAELAHASRVATLGELTSTIAHEVNQPLTAIINNANACLGLVPDSAPQLQEVRDALAEIIDDADRASAIIARVRQLARKAPPDKALLDMKNVVADVLAFARYETKNRRVTILHEFSKELPFVLGDRIQLQQVLLNLIVNGMDAMNTVEGSKRILKISGRSELQDGKPTCLLSVQDAGVGLKLNEIDKLFEAFHTTKPQGMGMGLAISRTIVEAHGGRLWAKPNQEVGATFLFTLPAARNITS
jgi:PAS domain S-box-containing protein